MYGNLMNEIVLLIAELAVKMLTLTIPASRPLRGVYLFILFILKSLSMYVKGAPSVLPFY